MKINTTNLNGILSPQNTIFKNSAQNPFVGNSEFLDINSPEPDVDTFELSSADKNMQEFEIADNAQAKVLEGFSFHSLEELQEQIAFNRWESKKEQCGTDSFALYADAQHLVFSQKLHDIGFFEGKSQEEIQQYEKLLMDITSLMSCVNEGSVGGGKVQTEGTERLYCYEGQIITMQKYDDSLYGVSSDMAKIGLESAKAALETFSDKYLTEEQQTEFSGLIDDFYSHNSEHLQTYKAWGEDVAKFAAAYRESGLADAFLSKGGDAINKSDFEQSMAAMKHTEAETGNYLNSITSVFKLMKQAGANSLDLWDMLKNNYLSHTTKGIESGEYKENIKNQSENVFAHMEGYWSELLE